MRIDCAPSYEPYQLRVLEELKLTYNLENLSWQEFERLAKFYLKEKIGEGLWVFDGSKDKGRDAAFIGTANEFPSKSAPYTGKWIFQSKHRTTRGKRLHKQKGSFLKR